MIKGMKDGVAQETAWHKLETGANDFERNKASKGPPSLPVPQWSCPPVCCPAQDAQDAQDAAPTGDTRLCAPLALQTDKFTIKARDIGKITELHIGHDDK